MTVFLLVVSLLAALAVAVFAEENHQPLIVAFLAWRATTTLPVVIFLSAALGAICAGLLSLRSHLRWRRRVRHLQAELARQPPPSRLDEAEARPEPGAGGADTRAPQEPPV